MIGSADPEAESRQRRFGSEIPSAAPINPEGCPPAPDTEPSHGVGVIGSKYWVRARVRAGAGAGARARAGAGAGVRGWG